MKNKILEELKGLIGPVLLSGFFNGIIICCVSFSLGIISYIITSMCMYRCLQIGFKDGKESNKE